MIFCYICTVLFFKNYLKSSAIAVIIIKYESLLRREEIIW